LRSARGAAGGRLLAGCVGAPGPPAPCPLRPARSPTATLCRACRIRVGSAQLVLCCNCAVTCSSDCPGSLYSKWLRSAFNLQHVASWDITVVTVNVTFRSLVGTLPDSQALPSKSRQALTSCVLNVLAPHLTGNLQSRATIVIGPSPCRPPRFCMWSMVRQRLCRSTPPGYAPARFMLQQIHALSVVIMLVLPLANFSCGTGRISAPIQLIHRYTSENSKLVCISQRISTQP
jgi:hypothetical protein